ncbi:hypothetical protein GCM10028821_29530 [Hymenobacter jeollabukensis]
MLAGCSKQENVEPSLLHTQLDHDAFTKLTGHGSWVQIRHGDTLMLAPEHTTIREVNGQNTFVSDYPNDLFRYHFNRDWSVDVQINNCVHSSTSFSITGNMFRLPGGETRQADVNAPLLCVNDKGVYILLKNN